MPKKKIRKRNLRDHALFRRHNPQKGNGCCSRCGAWQCWYNVTPSKILLTKANGLGKLRQHTCDQMIPDPILAADL